MLVAAFVSPGNCVPTANVCLTAPQARPLVVALVWIPSLILRTVAPAVPPVPVEKSVSAVLASVPLD